MTSIAHAISARAGSRWVPDVFIQQKNYLLVSLMHSWWISQTLTTSFKRSIRFKSLGNSQALHPLLPDLLCVNSAPRRLGGTWVCYRQALHINLEMSPTELVDC